jgi:hypothetical protein
MRKRTPPPPVFEILADETALPANLDEAVADLLLPSPDPPGSAPEKKSEKPKKSRRRPSPPEG